MSENDLPVIVRILLVKLCVVWVTFFYNLQIIVFCLEIILPPANEVCESNVFTGVCLSTRGGGALSRGVSVHGSLSRRGSLSGMGICVQGDPPYGKERYAPYWNAFSFQSFFARKSYTTGIICS